jgi:hypothetical protein
MARDAAGHTVTHEVFTPVEREQLRGVHMSGPGWATPELRQGVLALIDQGLIDAVQLDLKDEAGEVAYQSDVELAGVVGATRSYYDLDKVVEELHGRGVRVVGRIVAYRDPILAAWAWNQGNHDWVVQRPDGSMLADYGGFTNFANRQVQDYNLALAEEAADAGVDEVLWDYIRRPEGAMTDMVVPGLGTTAPEDAIVAFLERAHHRLRDAGVYQGASVFGISASRPEPVAQNIPKIARHVDYLAPMVYPSLFVNGEYRVPDPPRMPYDIVRRALDDFKAKTAGTGVHITPWLQDFSQVITYGDDQVRSQVRAAEDAGYTGWLLWNARVKYHTGKLDPIDG